MIAEELKNFLEKNHVKYVIITHSPAYTSQEIAASAHITGKKLAKTVILKVNGELAMAVIPAHEEVILEKLKHVTHTSKVELASQEEFQERFPHCEPGAMPPFGNLYGMKVFAATDFQKDEDIAFNAGNFRELAVVPYRDFERLVKPSFVERLSAVYQGRKQRVA